MRFARVVSAPTISPEQVVLWHTRSMPPSGRTATVWRLLKLGSDPFWVCLTRAWSLTRDIFREVDAFRIHPTCRQELHLLRMTGYTTRRFRLGANRRLLVNLSTLGKTKVGHVPELKRSTPWRVGLSGASHPFHLAHCSKKALSDVPYHSF